MKSAVEHANKRIKELYEEINNYKSFIVYAQKICTHDWVDAPELYDYHKREDFQKCSICGSKR